MSAKTYHLLPIQPKDIISHTSLGGKIKTMNPREEIVNKVLFVMDKYVNEEVLNILRCLLEDQLATVNVEKITTLPASREDTVDQQNQYYIELMKIKKKNLCERTKKAYTDAITRLLSFTDKSLIAIDAVDVDRYLRWYEYKNEADGKKKNQSSTCNNERRYLSAFFSWMRKEGFITYNPVENTEPLKEIQKPIDYFRPEEMEALKNHCKNSRDRALIEVLRSTGARLGEVSALNKTDIDWHTGDVLILSEKSNKYRMLYLDEASRYYLKVYLDQRSDDNEALFTTNIKPCRRLSNASIEYVLRQLGKCSGATCRVYPHKMRKTLGMRLRNAGVDVGSIQEILGHANPDTTARYYAQSTPDTLRDIRKKIA